MGSGGRPPEVRLRRMGVRPLELPIYKPPPYTRPALHTRGQGKPCPYMGFVPKPSNSGYVGTAFMAVREQARPHAKDEPLRIHGSLSRPTDRVNPVYADRTPTFFTKREVCPIDRSSFPTGRFSAIFRDFPNTRGGQSKIERKMSARSSLSSEKDNTGQVNHVNKPAREQGRGLEGARTEQGEVDEAGGPQC